MSSEKETETIFSHKREKAPNLGMNPKVVAAVIAVIILGFLRQVVDYDSDPITLSCSNYEKEVFSQVLEERKAILIVPARTCWTPIVLVPKDENFEVNADKCIYVRWEYEDGTTSGHFEYCPGLEFTPRKQARGLRFQNDGSGTDGEEVRLTITEG